MSPAPVLPFLAIATLLPCVPALRCQYGKIQTVRNASELPLTWTSGKETCRNNRVCHDEMIIIENGPEINLLITKGCIEAVAQEPRVTWHRRGPGLSIVSYTRVCHHSDFCNDLSTTEVVGNLPTPTVPGTMTCPHCFSKRSCDNAPERVCPAGSSHCYNGVLRLRGESIKANLRVQGCMPKPGCNLLNGTQNIGTTHVTESCDLQLGSQALDCKSGNLDTKLNVSDLHVDWTTGWKTCEIGEGCYETVILIQNGQELNLFMTKGCTRDVNKRPQITRHRTGPGISITSYVHVCRQDDFCNDLSSTQNIWIPPPVTVPGTLHCPHCLSARACDNAPKKVCPAGTHCYSGILRVRGEGISSNLRVQGCMPESGCNLLNGTKTIGLIDVNEDCSPRSGRQALDCRHGKLELLRKVSDLPVHWTTGWKTCNFGEGCEETVVLIENGPQASLVLTKGCTRDKDQKPRLVQHRTSPGLSITSYTHVCRSWDFCNDLASSEILWVPPRVTGPGTVRCPLCLSNNGCPKNAPEQVCPAGSTDCYNGVLELRGGNIFMDLSVQACIPKPGCDLFNGTQTIGPIDVNENCSPQLGGLKCQHGTLESLQEASELPLQWTAGQVTCGLGEGCQDTLMIVENGQQVSVVLTKGCTSAQDHEARVTEHRTGPGLSVISYTGVCRQKDLCNDLSTTAPLWAPPPTTAPGTLLCPHCLSRVGCDNAPKQLCPAGSLACYSGVLKLRGGEIFTSLGVQGCMSQSGCNLLNGTQKIGPLNVSENCSPKLDILTCHNGIMIKLSTNLAEEAVQWTSGSIIQCEAGEVCQETLLLVDVGPKSILVGSKGCSRAGERNARGVTILSQPPGMIVASYTQFCSLDLCNEASSSSVLLGSLPRTAAPRPGKLRCLVCVEFFGSCSGNTNFMTCPQGTTHCYNNDIELRGGGLSTTMSIRGCMTTSSKSLLGNSKTIGIFSAKEIRGDKTVPDPDRQSPDAADGAASVSYLAWVLGLGLSLALLYGGLLPVC